MSDLVIGIKIKADGSGLVGQAKMSTAAVAGIGDAAGAAGKDLDQLSQSATRAQGTIQGAASATFQLGAGFGTASPKVAELLTRLSQMGGQVDKLTSDLAGSQQAAAGFSARIDTLVKDLSTSQAAVAALAGKLDILETKLQNSRRGQRDSADAANSNSFAIRNLGQQFGDFGQQALSGAGVARAFSQQVGQMGYAMGEFQNGPLKGVGAFLVGPWGIALTIAIQAMAAFSDQLFTAKTKAEQQADSLKTLKGATDALDEATGRLNKTKREEIAIGDAAVRATLKEALATRALLQARLESLNSVKDAPVAGLEGAGAGLGLAIGSTGSALAANAKAIKEAQAALAGADVATAIAKAGAATNAATAANQKYETSLARLTELYNATNKTARNKADLDRAVLDITRLRDAEAKKASGTASSAIDIDARLASATNDVQRAEANLAKVRRDATAAVKAGTLSQADATAKVAEARTALNAARSAVTAHGEQTRELKKATDEAAASLKAMDDIVAALVTRFDPATTQAEKFAATLRDIADLTASGQLNVGQSAAFTLAASEENKAATLKSQQAAATRVFSEAPHGGGDPAQLLRSLIDAGEGIRNSIEDGSERGSILFKRAISEATQDLGGLIGGLVGGKAGSQVGGAISGLSGLLGGNSQIAQQSSQVRDALTKLTSKGVGISDEGAATIGRIGGKAFGGAATGAVTNSLLEPLAKGLGLKTSKTGAQVGGAIGSLSGIPGGDIIGSIAGSLIGGAFKKTKSGGATISDATSDATISGNSAAREKAAGSLAGAVQSGLAQIAEQLGGSVGSFGSLTIGQRDGDYRVQTGTSTSLKKKKGAADFGDDADAAVAFAIKTAVARGAVQGLDAAVQQALASSSDINEGLAEALKVQKVQELIGGVGYTLKKAFETFDAQAKQSFDLARKYGLDTLAVEKATGEARTKLISDTLKASVGSLQDLLKSMNGGDLFEGSAVDKRASLLDQIAETQAKANKGEDGAADTLAGLFQQLLSTDKENFGTAGPQYSNDIALVQAGAKEVIAAEQARIDQASSLQQQTNTAIATSNSLLDEQTELLIQNNKLLGDLVAATGGTSAGSGLNLAALRREVSLR